MGAVTEPNKSKTQKVGSWGAGDGGGSVSTKHPHTHMNEAVNQASDSYADINGAYVMWRVSGLC